jgi:hypothetical protein
LSVSKGTCISSGGAWLGMFEGCDILIDEGFYAMHISPMYFVIFVVFLVLMVASNLILKKLGIFK